jgi:hypothetical protein
MEPLPTTLDAINLARSFALHTLIKQRDELESVDDHSELAVALLEELINEIISSITPLEE